MRYTSKIDWWIATALLAAPGIPLALAAYDHRLLPVVVSACILILYVLVMVPISYEILPAALVIRTGVIKTRIPYSEIHLLRESRSAVSSPALSLDRIEIGYGQGRTVFISPKDKVGFLEDLRGRVALAEALSITNSHLR